jgi:hypothetical protein
VAHQQAELTQFFHRLQPLAVEMVVTLINQIHCPALVVRVAAHQEVLQPRELLLERQVHLGRVMLVVAAQDMAVQITLVVAVAAQEPQVAIQLLALMVAQVALVVQAVLQVLL